MRKMCKAASAAALLLLLSACGASTEAPRNDAAELVAFTQSEAFELCRTLPEDMIPDCITAARDW